MLYASAQVWTHGKGRAFSTSSRIRSEGFLLYDRAVKGELFTNKAPRGLYELGHVLFGILKQLGKNAPSKDILEELQRISGSAMIQEVDEESNAVYWRNSSGAEKTTSFRSIRNRLANLRKKNPH